MQPFLYIHFPDPHPRIALLTNDYTDKILSTLKQHNIDNYDISVWAERPQGNNFIRVYGHSFYSHIAGTLKYKIEK
jgi:hypothetical protein